MIIIETPPRSSIATNETEKQILAYLGKLAEQMNVSLNAINVDSLDTSTGEIACLSLKIGKTSITEEKLKALLELVN